MPLCSDEQPQRAAAALSAAVGDRPCAVLVNNAAVMSDGRDETLRTNLIAPAVLTLSLLPALRRHPAPCVINVGSTAHLRAGRVDPALLLGRERDARPLFDARLPARRPHACSVDDADGPGRMRRSVARPACYGCGVRKRGWRASSKRRSEMSAAPTRE